MMEAAVLTLQLDVGNSSTKWRLMEGARRIKGGRCVLDGESLDSLCAMGATSLWVASVAGDEEEEWIERGFRRRGVAPHFIRTRSECAGVRNSYLHPECMGVDRWLAMLAAYRRVRGGAVVVDAGTAATIDLVADGGEHIGGYILPGFKMMCSSLTGSTGRVRYDGEVKPTLEPGRQTGECVEAASWLALVSSVRGAVDRYISSVGSAPAVVMTGGDAGTLALLAGRDASDWEVVDELVLDGLAIAAQAENLGAD